MLVEAHFLSLETQKLFALCMCDSLTYVLGMDLDRFAVAITQVRRRSTFNLKWHHLAKRSAGQAEIQKPQFQQL